MLTDEIPNVKNFDRAEYTRFFLCKANIIQDKEYVQQELDKLPKNHRLFDLLRFFETFPISSLEILSINYVPEIIQYDLVRDYMFIQSSNDAVRDSPNGYHFIYEQMFIFPDALVAYISFSSKTDFMPNVWHRTYFHLYAIMLELLHGNYELLPDDENKTIFESDIILSHIPVRSKRYFFDILNRIKTPDFIRTICRDDVSKHLMPIESILDEMQEQQDYEAVALILDIMKDKNISGEMIL